MKSEDYVLGPLPIVWYSPLPCVQFGTMDVPWEWFTDLRDEVPWRQDTVTLFGKTHNVPRLQQWYGDKAYTYSGIKMNPLPWTPLLEQIKTRVECAYGLISFNSVLVNRYVDGDHNVAWHADDEPELGEEPLIASLSLGAPRDFVLKHNTTKAKVTIPLKHGSVVFMSGDCQKQYKHCVPKRKNAGDRINLTFRTVKG